MADPDRSVLEDARKRARRRLVGAIVLALGAAVVLPLFLETDPKPLGPDVQLQIPAIDDGKFQNRLTPEPKGSAKDGKDGKDGKGEIRAAPSSTAAASSTTVAPLTTAAPSTTAAPAIAAAPSTTASAAAPPQAPVVSPPSPAPATAAAPAAASTPAPAATAAQAAARTAPAASEASNSASAPAAAPATGAGAATPAIAATITTPTARQGNPNGAFVVQLGAFVGLPIAVELADKARDQGYPVFLEKVTTTTGAVHRVRVGPYATQAQAQADAVKLKLAGFTADVRKR